MRVVFVLLVCLVVGAGVVAPVASAAPGAVAPLAVPGEDVTLLTGDTVTLGTAVNGEPTVAVRPEDTSTGSSFTTLRLGADIYVVPDDVDHLVPDVLDLELFNVTGLVAMGYADSATDVLPLIVRGPRSRLADAGTALPRPDVRWRHCVTGPRGAVARLCEPLTAYSPGGRLSPEWFGAPAPAVIAGSHSANRILLPVALSDGEHHGSVFESAAWGSQSLRLYRDGVELPRVGTSPYFDSPPEAATFRLDHTSTPNPDRLPIGRQTSTSWTFPSRAPDTPGQFATTPRLLTVDYRPNTDAMGRLRPWQPLTLGLRMVSTAGADDVRGERGTLRLWASTDQGTHWREATVLPRHDGTFTAFVPGLVLRSGQTVSVRVRATAQEGRAVDQTIVDAYPVR